MKRVAFLGLVVCLLASGCDDSKNPLSDPQTAKPDNRLIGVWRQRGENGEVTYYHVGHAGENFPDGMLRIVWIKHDQGKIELPQECLAFTTVLGGKTYLNVVWEGGKKQVKLLEEGGWKADAVDYYTFVKYQVDGDKAVVWLIDEDAKERAIKSGKVKGVIEPNKPPKFTDTAENVARFVAEAGDSLFKTKEPFRFERVDAGKKP